jgi:putative nucleotidyltransferase with HDIG domain
MRPRSQHRLPAAIERIEALPALAESRNRLLLLLGDAKSPPRELVAAIESDVGLAAAVMRRANAEPRSKVTAIGKAVEVITPAGLEKLVRGMDTYDFFERRPGWDLPPERFRLHALAVASMVNLLARELGYFRWDELLVAALLHDVGKVVMAEAYPDYPQQLLDTDHTPDERAAAERRAHGVDHSVIGGVLLRRWRLPAEIAHAVERHHAADATGAAGILRLGDMLAHYERGAGTAGTEIEQAAGQIGIRGPALHALMYRLPDRGEAHRRQWTPSPLSVQEREVLRGLAASKVYNEIAVDMKISASTVRSHVHKAYPKLGAVDRAQAVLAATREGWL